MAEAQAASTSPTAAETQPNWLMGTLAAAGLALAAAIVYALVAILTDNEIGYLALLIGLAAGFGFVKFGGFTSMAAGAVAAIVALLSWILALVIIATAVIADSFGVGFMDAFGEFVPLAGDFFSEYMKDALSWLFLALTIVPAFYLASGLKDRTAK